MCVYKHIDDPIEHIPLNSIDNAIEKITDKPAQNIGNTIADIWFLVFGRISHLADKKRIKYAIALQEYEKELKSKIAQIPDDQIVEPDLQIIAPALEASKYCVLHKELRDLFANLISSSLDSQICNFVHPSFSDVIRQMTVLDAKTIALFNKQSLHPICKYRVYYNNNSFDDFYTNVFLSNNGGKNLIAQSVSMSSLERLGLIKINYDVETSAYKYESFEHTDLYQQLILNIKNNELPKATDVKIIKGVTEITPYGELFLKACLNK